VPSTELMASAKAVRTRLTTVAKQLADILRD
jgi:hypothetical protein